MSLYGVAIAGTGSYVPDRVLTNQDLEQMVDTTDEWIRTRTGIRERRIAADNQPTSVLAFEAAARALQAADMTVNDLDLIIVATISPDHQFPNTACYVQKQLRAENATCFSLEAACSGFVYSLQVGASLIRAGLYKNALIIGAEKLSSVVDWTDRNTCVLFGDGAGAMILSRTEPEKDALLASRLGSDGTYTDLLYVPAGGSAMPTTPETLKNRLGFLNMNGREVFKLAVNAMVNAANDVLAETGISADDIRWLVPHQANDRIIQAVGKRLNIENGRVFVNLDKYGNTSAATVPIAIDEIARGGQINPGEYLLMVAFGGGLTWGAALIRW
jgi:3-oxoacyl-[acyl-carrier-protein] synthase-3